MVTEVAIKFQPKRIILAEFTLKIDIYLHGLVPHIETYRARSRGAAPQVGNHWRECLREVDWDKDTWDGHALR
jgi:hypothetical protein